MKKVFKVRDDQIEIENVWIKLEENTIIERFPKITKIILNRESQTDAPGSSDDLQTIHNIDFKVFSKLKDLDSDNQSDIDNILLKLDGTENKTNLGANATLAVSLAI